MNKEKKFEIEHFKYWADKYWELLNAKNKVTIFVIELCVALLVIASFSNNLISNEYLIQIKILIVFILALIPVMLVDYILQLNEGLLSINTIIKIENNLEKNKFLHIVDGTVYLYSLFGIIIIDIIISMILSNTVKALLLYIGQSIIIAIIVFSKRLRNKKN